MKLRNLLFGAFFTGLGLVANAASDLTVHSGGTLIVHTNVQVNSGTFSVESGGNVQIDLGSKITATNVVYGGTLTVSSNNITLAANQSYMLFSAPTYSGAFVTINLPALTSNLSWTNTLLSNGTIAVKSTASPTSMQFSTISYSGTQMVFSGSGGTPNATYVVLTSTNLSLAKASWTMLATNTFNGSGNFSFTRPIDNTTPQRFFVVEIP